ncbi:MAG TPA: Xaa-Pro peptidase family protein [Bryobacteraceae bacterium]|nr:Xaa-Pro peptidase family protein [Bryobacteraceae bacterium]
MDLARIQEALRREKLDGWLFFDHHQRDLLAYRVLGLDPHRHVTRRWYYLIPAEGEPRGIVHRIESGVIGSLPGEKLQYSSWQEQHACLAQILKGVKRVAMQYSPRCAVPYVAMVDAGTVELVRDQGVEVASSAELIQEFEACLSQTQFATHVEAGKIVDRVRAEAFHFIGGKPVGEVDELTVRDWILDQFRRAGLITENGPIVGVNAHAGDPHYEPRPETNAAIRPGDLVLLDMWAKFDKPGSVFYDITWTGFRGDPPDRIRTVFEIVRDARDAAIQAVAEAVSKGREIRGFEVDDAARAHIQSKGFGERFVHRTGHSIGEEVHGTGANMDNLETHDDRRILPGALFSVEPGIYLPEFGIRSEVNVFVSAKEAVVTGEVQRDLVTIR